MYRLLLGKVSVLSAGFLPPALITEAPSGPRRPRWLAGRALLARAVSPLPDIGYGEQGKPCFSSPSPLWFNLSHSGDDIALLLSDEGEVGCDIEALRPRARWPALAEALFSPGERAQIAAAPPAAQLPTFWQIWTRKEAMLKQRGGSVWQMAQADSTQPDSLFIAHHWLNTLSIAVCTPTPVNLAALITSATVR